MKISGEYKRNRDRKPQLEVEDLDVLRAYIALLSTTDWVNNLNGGQHKCEVDMDFRQRGWDLWCKSWCSPRFRQHPTNIPANEIRYPLCVYIRKCHINNFQVAVSSVLVTSWGNHSRLGNGREFCAPSPYYNWLALYYLEQVHNPAENNVSSFSWWKALFRTLLTIPKVTLHRVLNLLHQ